MTVLITGGSGFIGKNFIINYFKNRFSKKLINIDKLTYAGENFSQKTILKNDKYYFFKTDISNKIKINSIFSKFKPKYIINFAAETHVDRSINNPEIFIQTNINSTYNFLSEAFRYWENLNPKMKDKFIFLHVSTDEVYGSLSKNENPFTENSQYKPNSPYAASKAASDHLVRSFNKTYNFPTIISNCSNNYGPYQYPEKLIPLIIYNAIQGKKLPIYGDGKQIRDWIYVDDHCDALLAILKNKKVGERYNIGSENQITNLSLVEKICKILDKEIPKKNLSYKDQITFVKDRKGHDRRYATNCNKMLKEINWKPKINFEEGLIKTVRWYLNNLSWASKSLKGQK